MGFEVPGQDEFDELEERVTDMQADIDDLESTINDLQETIEDLTAKLDKLLGLNVEPETTQKDQEETG